MNDDFLHRLRKAPPPGFLAELKGRLDRQPAVPPPPRRRHRWMLLGLLLAGTAFAFVAWLGRAPLQLRERDDNQLKVVPLGPVWLPEHPAPGTAGDDEPPPSSMSAQPAGYTAPVVMPRYEYMTLLATSRVLPPDTGNVVVRPTPEATAFANLCNLDATVLEVSRRITPDESNFCLRRRVAVAELKTGYQAVVMARPWPYGPLRISARGLFLALAKRIPDPAHPHELIDNPNTLWSDVDARSPFEPGHIQVIGPAPNSPPGRLAAQLLLEAGCNTYPWIAALRDNDPARYEQICDSFRNDGAYRAPRVPWSIAEELAANTAAWGVFSQRELDSNRYMLASPIDGIEPSLASVAAGTYPASRTLYMYAKKRAVDGSRLFGDLMRHITLPADLNGPDPPGWGFMTLDAQDRNTTSITLQQLTGSSP